MGRFDTMVTVQLIQPPRSQGYGDNSRSACYVPLGLVSIATYVQSQLPNARVEILDGEFFDVNDIIDRLKPGSFVGLDTKAPNYESALLIARAAKDISCRVILGGVYASAIPERILSYRSAIVDHLVVGYGEIPVVEIINGRTDPLIRNGSPAFNDIPLPKRDLFLDLEPYIENFQRQHKTWGNLRATNTFTHVGCKYRCLFCERTKPTKGVYFVNPPRFWEEVTSLVQTHGIDYVVDFSDTLTQNTDFLRDLVEAKPAIINPQFHVFSTADGINSATIELLQRLNVKHVFVGVESGDETLARTIHKGRDFSPKMTFDAIAQLAAVDIKVTPSFVLGLPGESKETLQRTYDHARKIYDIFNFEEIFCAGLIPFPGSPAFRRLEQRVEARGQLFYRDIYDPEQLRELWISEFCNVDSKEIMEFTDKLLGLGKYRITIRKETTAGVGSDDGV